jgi:acetate kinase
VSRCIPSALQIATFDTNFFASLPPAAAHIPLPPRWVDKLGLRRYGFHGMAHHSMWQTFAARRPDLNRGGRLVTLQLGSGCSATAIMEGQAVDTSMGFGPLQGLVMTTRSGDVDPAVLMYVQKVEGVTAQDMEKALYQQSGLFAVSRGESKDMGELLKSQSPDAALAVDMFCYACVKYIGAYAAVLGGLDGIVFGGGIGEKGKEIRRRVCERLAWMGVVLDVEVNGKSDGTGRISKAVVGVGKGKSGVDVWVVSVDEAKVMIEEGQHLLAEGDGKDAERSAL